MNAKLKFLGAGLAVGAVGVLVWAVVPPASSKIEIRADAPAASGDFSYAAYAEVLEAYVDDRGLVDYRGLKANSLDLDQFLAAVARLDPAAYRRWDENKKIAFWINVYNAFTLKVIITHYPIKPSLVASLRFPKNSIRQIPGAWHKLQFSVMGTKTTLDAVEHQTLRRQFDEPAIHMALVCAAMSCPVLRNEPYTAGHLKEQFEDQAKRFLANPQKFRIDRQRRIVYLSPIFKWFGEDFVNNYGTNEGFADQDLTGRAVLNYVSRHIGRANADYLRQAQYSVRYLSYDWLLNEQR